VRGKCRKTRLEKAENEKKPENEKNKAPKKNLLLVFVFFFVIIHQKPAIFASFWVFFEVFSSFLAVGLRLQDSYGS
jgi:hypothetical protein